MRRFRLHAFGFIIYLVLALLKVAFVNFTLNEYIWWWWWWPRYVDVATKVP